MGGGSGGDGGGNGRNGGNGGGGRLGLHALHVRPPAVDGASEHGVEQERQRDDRPLELLLDSGAHPPWLDAAMQTMRVGEVSCFLCGIVPPHVRGSLAHAAVGAGWGRSRV